MRDAIYAAAADECKIKQALPSALSTGLSYYVLVKILRPIALKCTCLGKMLIGIMVRCAHI